MRHNRSALLKLYEDAHSKFGTVTHSNFKPHYSDTCNFVSLHVTVEYMSGGHLIMALREIYGELKYLDTDKFTLRRWNIFAEDEEKHILQINASYYDVEPSTV